MSTLALPLHSSDSSVSILSRISSDRDLPSLRSIPSQAMADQVISTFLGGVTDMQTLTALTAGGYAYRLGRLGILGLGAELASGSVLPALLRGGSYLVGFAAESFTFAGVNQGFSFFEGQTPKHPLTHDWAQAAITLAPLKIIPALFQDQNLVLQHLVTDGAMVAGNQLAYRFKLGEKPEGDLLSQLFHAEAVNWQMGGSLGLLQGLSPHLQVLNQSMDLLLHSQSRPMQGRGTFFGSLFDNPNLAVEGGPSSISFPEKDNNRPPFIMMTGKGGNEKGPGEEREEATARTRNARITEPLPGDFKNPYFEKEKNEEPPQAFMMALNTVYNKGGIETPLPTLGIVIGHTVGHGFWIQYPKQPTMREMPIFQVVREGEDITDPFEKVFLRTGDRLTLPGFGEKSFIFVDPIRAPFGGGHQYASQKLPSDFSNFLTGLVQGSPGRFVPWKNSGTEWIFHPILGAGLRHVSGASGVAKIYPREDLLPHSKPGPSDEYYLREGDVIQIGEESPFVFSRIGRMSIGSSTGRYSFRLVRGQMPEVFARAAARAFHDPSTEQGFKTGGVSLRIYFLPGIPLHREDGFLIGSVGRQPVRYQELIFEKKVKTLPDLRFIYFSFSKNEKSPIFLFGDEEPFRFNFEQMSEWISKLKPKERESHHARPDDDFGSYSQDPSGAKAPPPIFKERELNARKILGLPLDSELDERTVKRTYRALSRKLHPDMHPRASEAARREMDAKFAELTHAYEFLLKSLKNPQ